MKEYAVTHPGSTLTVTTIVQTSLDQKLTLLASAGDLPTMFVGPQDPSQQEQMGKAGYSLNIQTALTKLGVFNELKPSAVKIIDTLQGGLYAIPDQLAMEGFWYNKKIFAQDGITPPTTWSALVSDAKALTAKGVQPLAADGMDGWPLTRIISGYIFRELGPNALLKVSNGQAKLTDPAYVKAAQAAAALGTAGYFGKGFATLGYTAAEEEFLSSKAAMFYMGTWALPDFSNTTLGTIGASNVGFFPFFPSRR
jgi:raffinose/stachyose/melibiose transport system substrate-binding protein